MRKKFQGSLLMALAGISVATMAQSARPVAVPRHVQDIITGRCALCHGPEGESASAVYPRLAAQHPDYLQKQLRDFRDGRRVSDPMSEMAKDLKDDDIAALAAFFASRKAGARQPGDVELANVEGEVLKAAMTAPGRPAPRIRRNLVEGVQQARAYQRQRDHALDRFKVDRTRNPRGFRLYRRPGIGIRHRAGVGAGGGVIPTRIRLMSRDRTYSGQALPISSRQAPMCR